MLKRFAALFIVSTACLNIVQADIPNPLRNFWRQQETPMPPTIQVLVGHDLTQVQFEVVGKYKIIDPLSGKELGTRFSGKSRPAQAIGSGIKWGEEFPGYHQITIIPTEMRTRIFVDGTEYRGTISIYDTGGTISVVNELPIEAYLISVMTHKYSPNLSEEALAAFAIAERTNAYYQSQYPKTKFWAVDGALSSFNGKISTGEDAPFQNAVKSTQCMVMSTTSAYEGVVTPFPIQWDTGTKSPANASLKSGVPTLSVIEVEQMAQKGEHAASILEKLFPRTTIQLIHFRNG